MHHMVVSGMYAWGAARSLFPTLVPYSFCPGPTRGACMMLLLGTTRPGPPPPPPPCPYKRYMQDDACPLAGPTCMRGTFGAYPSACCVVPGCMQPPGVGYMVVYRPPPALSPPIFSARPRRMDQAYKALKVLSRPCTANHTHHGPLLCIITVEQSGTVERCKRVRRLPPPAVCTGSGWGIPVHPVVHPPAPYCTSPHLLPVVAFAFAFLFSGNP